MIQIHSDVPAAVVAIHGPDAHLVDDVEVLSKVHPSGIDRCTLVCYEVEILSSLTMYLIAKGDLGGRWETVVLQN